MSVLITQKEQKVVDESYLVAKSEQSGTCGSQVQAHFSLGATVGVAIVKPTNDLETELHNNKEEKA